MTVITYRELQRISAKKLVEKLPVVITLEGVEVFKMEVYDAVKQSTDERTQTTGQAE